MRTLLDRARAHQNRSVLHEDNDNDNDSDEQHSDEIQLDLNLVVNVLYRSIVGPGNEATAEDDIQITGAEPRRYAEGHLNSLRHAAQWHGGDTTHYDINDDARPESSDDVAWDDEHNENTRSQEPSDNDSDEDSEDYEPIEETARDGGDTDDEMWADEERLLALANQLNGGTYRRL